MRRGKKHQSSELQVLRKHGFRPSEEELKAMIENCEKDEKMNGGIDFNEFIAMMTRQDILYAKIKADKKLDIFRMTTLNVALQARKQR